MRRWLGHHKPSFTIDTYVHLLEGDIPDPTFLDDIAAPSESRETREAEADAVAV